MSASYGEFADLTTKRLEVGEANIEQLKTENANISGRLTVGEAEIKVIKTDKANIKDLEDHLMQQQALPSGYTHLHLHKSENQV